MKTSLTILLIFFISFARAQCDLNVDYAYQLDGDTMRISCLTEDLSPDAEIYCEVFFSDDYYDPTVYEGLEIAIPYILFIEAEKHVYINYTLLDEGCSAMKTFVIYSGREKGCSYYTDFKYSVNDEEVKFFHTIFTTIDGFSFEWRENGELFSTDEEPVVPIEDFPAEAKIELTINHDNPACVGVYHETIFTDPDGWCHETELSFYGVRSADSTTFYNTSTNIKRGALFSWARTDLVFPHIISDDSLTLPNTYLDTIDCMFLEVNYYRDDESPSCRDFLMGCFTDSDTICTISANYDLTYEDGVFYLSNTSTSLTADAEFEWYIDGLLSTDENITIDLADIEDGAEICFNVTDLDGTCTDSYCHIINLEADTVDCSLTEASFYYYSYGDSIYFVNTSEDVVYGATTTWHLNYAPYEGDDTLVVPLDLIDVTMRMVLIIDYDDYSCRSRYDLYIDPDSIPELPCELISSFTHEIIGDSIFFTSFVSDPPPVVYYNWTNDGELFSTDVNPTLYIPDLDSVVDIIFQVTDSLECMMSFSETINTIITRTCDSNEVSFYYTVEADSVTFYNTSVIFEDEVEVERKLWSLGGIEYPDPLDWLIIRRPISDFDPVNIARIIVEYPLSHSVCSDSIEVLIETEIDTTIYSPLMAFFDYEMDEEYIEFMPEIIGGRGPFTYEWLIDDIIYYEIMPILLPANFLAPFEACLTVMEIEGSGSDTYCRIIDPGMLSILDVDSDLLTFYPNPADQFITIKLGEVWSETYTIQILNMSGQVVQTIDTYNQAKQIQIPLDNMSAGMYIIQVSTPNEALNNHWKFTKM